MTPPVVSWVIVAFHRPETLGPLVRAAAGDPGIELIVVNVEDDEQVSSVAAAGASLIPTATNVGYAAAVNLGARRATGDVVVFSNDDLEIDASSVLKLADAVRTGQGDVVLPAIVTAAGERELTVCTLPTPRTLLWEWALLPDQPVAWLARGLAVQKWRTPLVAERVEAGTAAVVAVRRDVLLSEPLPEQYFLYWEEIEWFWRLRERGMTVQFRPEIVVRHRGGRSEVRADKARLLARNAVRFVRRTQGRGAAARAVLCVVLWQLRLLVVDGAKAAVGRARGERVAARAAGLHAAVLAWREIS